MNRSLPCSVAFFLFSISLFWPKIGSTQSPLPLGKDSFLTVADFWRDSLPPYAELDDESLRELSKRLVSQASLLENQLIQEFNYAEYAREQAEIAQKKKQKDPATPLLELQEVGTKLAQAEARVRKTKALRDKAAKTRSLAEKTSKKSPDALRWELPKVEAAIISLLHQTEAIYNLPQKLPGQPDEEKGIVPTQPSDPSEEFAEAEKAQKPAESPQKRRNWDDYEQYDRQKDPLFFPPKTVCEIAFDGKDEFSGERRVELKRDLLWTHTNDFMRNFLKDKPHILGEANLSATSSGLKFLNLTITINDNNAKKGFGGLQRGAMLTLKFIDGTSLTLRNARSDEGVADETGGFATFTALFPITDKGELSQIRKKEIDRIRLAWATGFEDYEIFNVDLLMRQAECLFK